MTKSYTRFEIGGKEYELKFGLKAIKLIDETGGPFEFVQKAMQGGISDFVDVVYFALIHTNEGITHQTVQDEIERKLLAEELDFDDILKYNKEVVLNSFFFKKTVTKLMAGMPEEQKEAFEKLYE